MRSYSESKGHRKLRLCSKKYYETFKYSKPKISLTKSGVIQPLNLSLPISTYCDLVADGVESLLARVKKLNNLPHGSDLAVCMHETYILQIGWINFSHGKRLCFCQLESGDYGTEVTFSVAVQEDFTWTITYKKQIVPCTNSLLKNIPTCINSGKINAGSAVQSFIYIY